MLNLNSYNNHNREYEKGESLEKERVAHEEHNLEGFKFLYQDDIPHGNNLDKHSFEVAVDIGAGTTDIPSVTSCSPSTICCSLSLLNGIT